jgi:chemotaxis signal transduction protein
MEESHKPLQAKNEVPETWLLQMAVAETVFAVEAAAINRIVHMAQLLEPPGMPSFL